MGSIFKKTKIAMITSMLALSFNAMAAEDTVKVGLILPFTGVYANYGDNIVRGLKQFVKENGGVLGGKKVEYIVIDDESDVAKAEENAKKAIERDKVDIFVGTVHSGVTAKFAEIAVKNKKLFIIPQAGDDTLTSVKCSPYVFRISFSNWQISAPIGDVLGKKGAKTAITVSWDYSYGHQAVDAFKERFKKYGGNVSSEIFLKFPDVNFKETIETIKKERPEAVFVALAGSGGPKFIADYNKAGLKKEIPLYSNGYLTEGLLDVVFGGGANGIQTTFDYAVDLPNEKNKEFRKKYNELYNREPDAIAVHGYDLGQLYNEGLKAAGGNQKNIDEIIKGMEKANIVSPRGKFTLSKAHNPIENIYLRTAKGSLNEFTSIAVENLEDPATGCNMK